MAGSSEGWDGEIVARWLDSRVRAAGVAQAEADRRGYEAQDDYDKAAAEEWACRTLAKGGRAADQAGFAAHLKQLLAQEDYAVTGVYDDRRFDRQVRACLRRIARMTKANEGFANTLHHQG